MLKIIHRVNSIKLLKEIPTKYGVEVDVRAYRNTLILNHEPFMNGERLDEYLQKFLHKFIIFNIKETGIEHKVITLCKKYEIRHYFLLDVEFPYLYKASREGVRDIAIRYSEDEPIEQALKYKGMVDWVWIDTNTRLPLNKSVVEKLSGFKTCLVSPDRWGRPQDIHKYKEKLQKLNFKLAAVMTDLDLAPLW